MLYNITAHQQMSEDHVLFMQHVCVKDEERQEHSVMLCEMGTLSLIRQLRLGSIDVWL